MTLRPLRNYQLHAIELLRQSLREGHRRPVLAIPCGGGKTLIAINIFRKLLEGGKTRIFVVPRLVLIDQTVRQFEREGLVDLGVIQGNHPRRNPDARIQIASAQTLIRREIPKADLVIVDENHIQFDSINKWIASPEWASTIFVGLSATPWARGMGTIWDDLIKPVSIQELINDGFLSPFRVFIEASPDLTGVRVLGGDFREDDLAALAGRSVALNANIISTWLEKGENRPTLVYAVDRNHARILNYRFLTAGVPSEYIDGNTPQDEREAIFRRYADGITKIICNVAVCDTGLDVDARCIVDARPTKSRINFVQRVGRGLRIAEGKDDLIILDHAGNNSRLGPVTQIHVRRLLNGSDREEQEVPAGVPDPDDPRSGPKNVVENTGELIEMNLKATILIEPVGEREIFYAMLQHYSRSRGYKYGLAPLMFKMKFGYFPTTEIKCVEPRQPDDMALTWIRLQLSGYAQRSARVVSFG